MIDFLKYYLYYMFSYQIPISCPVQSISSPVLINGWVSIYELSGCGFESRCSHLNQSVKLGVKLAVCNLKNDQIRQIKIEILTQKYSRCYKKKIHRDTTFKYINTPKPILIVSALRITGHHLLLLLWIVFGVCLINERYIVLFSAGTIIRFNDVAVTHWMLKNLIHTYIYIYIYIHNFHVLFNFLTQ